MKKILLGITIMLLSLFIDVYAGEPVSSSNYDEEINIIEKANLMIKSRVDISDNVDGSGLYFGETINLDSMINGAALLAGDTININGGMDYGIIFGTNINIDGSVNRDVFIVGSKTNINNGNIFRDAFIASDVLTISGKIGRNLNFVGKTVLIKEGSNISGNLFLDADKIIIEDDVTINGKIEHRTNANLNIANVDQYDISTFSIKRFFSGQRIFNFSISFVNTTISQIVVFLVGMLIVPKLFNKIKNVYKKPKELGSGLLTGLATFLLTPIVAIFLVVLPFTRGLSFVCIASYIIMMYLAIIMVGYMLGLYINKRMKKEINPYLIGTIGILIVKIITIFPLFLLIAILLGMGTMVKMIMPYIKAKSK